MKPNPVKVKFMLLLCAMLLYALPAKAQTAVVDLPSTTITIEKVFSEIEKQTNYLMVFSNRDLNVKQTVTLASKKAQVSTILNEVLKNKNLTYECTNNYIVISKKEGAPAQTQQPATPANYKRVSGTVIDGAGEPLIGVNVAVKGDQKRAVVTDINGEFTLDAPADGSLDVSYIGFTPQTVSVAGKSNINITLKEDAKKLDEVVVIGYTAQKKGLLAGSVETTKFDKTLTELPVGNAASAMVGKMSGVNISTPDGKPGSTPSVSVRTGTTWNASPMLYIIDGAVSDATAFNNLSPNEIDNVSVLKDAASAAIYGARSDAGVILVTTKKGQMGKPVINYTTNFSWDHATNEVDLTNLYEAGMLTNTMYSNFGLTTPAGDAWSDEELEWAKNLPGGGYSAMDAIWHTPFVMNHSASLSGGNERFKYFAAANYYTQTGFMKSTDYDKINLRMNLTADITNDLQAYMSISNTNTYTKSAPTEGTDATYLKLRATFNNFPMLSTDGTKYIGNGWAYGNAAAEADGALGYNQYDVINPTVNFNLTYKLPWVPGLSFKAAYMGSWRNLRGKVYRSATTFWYPATSGANGHIVNVDDAALTNSYTSTDTPRIYAESEWNTSQQLNFQAAYDQTFGKHHVYGTLVYEYSKSKYGYLYGQRQFFPLYQTDQFWAANSSSEYTTGGGGPDYDSGRSSYIFQGGYDYNLTYILSFSLRYDGSMNFAPKKRWGLFPAASAAWVMSSEPFLRDNNSITYLKLRGSVGLTGNDAIGGWQWQESYSTGNSFMMGENLSKIYGLRYGSLVNPNLTWEKSLSYNVGVDYEFLSHLYGSVEYWYKHTYDILGTRQNSLPTTFSRTLPAENYGVVDAQGFDINIGWRDRTGNVDWHAQLTGSYGWNKVKEKDYSEGLLDWEIPVGKSTNCVAAYEGYILRSEEMLNEFKANNPDYHVPAGGLPLQVGSFVIVDKSGPDGKPDGYIDRYDKQVIFGNSNPFYFGLNLGAAWNNFDIGMTFTGKLRQIKNFSAIADYYNGQMFNTEWITNSWTPENPNAELPMVAPRDYRSYSWGDVDYWYKKVNYIRLSNLSIGYTFKFAKPLGNAISSIKLFATGTNLFYISNFKHWDPELGPSWSGIGYPIMRTLGGGVSINF